MDYYEILGVAREASEQDIKKAFRQIARECHPDVTGDDPVAAERFKTARKAYETLIDPVTRGRYDRRGQRKFGGGSFFDAFYNRAGGGDAGKGAGKSGPQGGAPHDAGGSPFAGRKAKKNPNNNLDLEDLFRDFGDFGGGPKTSGPSAGRRPDAPPPPPRQNAPEGGADVEIDLEVDARTARDGGTVTVVYGRLQRNASWRPGAPDPGVVKLQDIADIRIIPGTPDGETLREKGLGDAGAYGGQYGDLIVRVKLVGAKPRQRPPQERPGFDPPTQEEPRPRHTGAPPPESRPPSEPAEESAARVTPDATGTATVDVSIAEAILGGRIPLDTPQGRVRISIPPGTSSGTRMRLKGKGDGGVDLFVVIRIVVPTGLDDESRRLIEEFARLNPGLPRD